jgi:tRNA 2-thiocytidine biosynthesis protein TtcA
MLKDWDKQSPGRVENIFNATKSISPSQLADTELFDFTTLSVDRSKPRKEYEFNSEEVSSTNIDESLVIQIANL